MGMYRTITYDGKNYNFKASAGTDLLYKRLFKVDLDVVFKNTFMGLGDIDASQVLKEAMEVRELPNDDPEKIRKGLELISANPEIFNMRSKFVEFAKSFGFITYLEANNEPKDINKYLTVEEYTLFLMGFDGKFFSENTDVFRSLYEENMSQGSTAKN